MRWGNWAGGDNICFEKVLDGTAITTIIIIIFIIFITTTINLITTQTYLC